MNLTKTINLNQVILTYNKYFDYTTAKIKLVLG